MVEADSAPPTCSSALLVQAILTQLAVTVALTRNRRESAFYFAFCKRVLCFSACSGMVFGLTCWGGYTRLTRSGLSMTDWRFQGKNLPSTAEEWEAEFGRYKVRDNYKRAQLEGGSRFKHRRLQSENRQFRRTGLVLCASQKPAQPCGLLSAAALASFCPWQTSGGGELATVQQLCCRSSFGFASDSPPRQMTFSEILQRPIRMARALLTVD